MKKFIQNTYLKFTNLFSKSKKTEQPAKHPSAVNLKHTSIEKALFRELESMLVKFGHEQIKPVDRDQLLKDLDEMQGLAGIKDWKNRIVRQQAIKTVYDHEVDAKAEEIRNSQDEFDRIKQQAKWKAEDAVRADETAKISAILMEERTHVANESIKKMVEAWKEYFEISKDEKPTAKLFGSFLVKKKYISKKQMDNVRVAAVFHADSMMNPYTFHEELERVKQLY